ncbi:MAG TPA: hypothetical protein VE221_05875 [Sphingomicrobium sp.]|nr:hypothetical protein [Sphingomicrobium sp.]
MPFQIEFTGALKLLNQTPELPQRFRSKAAVHPFLLFPRNGSAQELTAKVRGRRCSKDEQPVAAQSAMGLN